MKEETMNVEALSRPELLTLLSILEGELEAQDVVVHALRAQHRDSFIQERYGQYDLSDPFLALQRDQQGAERGEARPRGGGPGGPVGPDPRAVLRLVMAHCKRMQERMTAQLAAAQLRHRRVISDLEGEKRQHAQDLAHAAGVSSMLQNQRDQLLQQLEAERAAALLLKEERAQAAGRAQEVLAQQQQEEVQRAQEVLAQQQQEEVQKAQEVLAQQQQEEVQRAQEVLAQQEQQEALSARLHRAEGRAQEELQRAEELHARLLEERNALQTLQGALQEEVQARTESQETRFLAEREQMKARLQEEQERSSELERQLEELRRRLREREGGEGEGQLKEAPPKTGLVCAAVQTEPTATQNVSARGSKVNGHRTPPDAECPAAGNPAENGGVAAPPSPLHPSPHPVPHSPSSTASSSLSSSPISSPVLAKRLGSPPGSHQSPHQSPYQASVTQRFQAARHKFQSQAELEQQHLIGSAPLSPRELSPTPPLPLPPPDNSSARQLARNTVAQVLSRFTSQQAGVKSGPIGSSPFGTDYRTLGSPSGGGRSPSSGPLSPGPRSPVPPRSGTPGPPPIAPKRPGMSPTPGSPTPGSPGPCARGPCARGTSVFPELTGSGPEGSTEPDLVCSSGS